MIQDPDTTGAPNAPLADPSVSSPSDAPGQTAQAASFRGTPGTANPPDTHRPEAPAFSLAYPNERSDYPRDAAAMGKWMLRHSAAHRAYQRQCFGVFLLLAVLEYLLYCVCAPLNSFTHLMFGIVTFMVLFFALFTFVEPFRLWVLGLILARRAAKQIKQRTDPPKHAVRYDFYPDRLEVFHGDTPGDCPIFALRAAFEGRMRWCLMDDYLGMKGPAMTYNAYQQEFLSEDEFSGFIHLAGLSSEQRAQLLAYLGSASEWRRVENFMPTGRSR